MARRYIARLLVVAAAASIASGCGNKEPEVACGSEETTGSLSNSLSHSPEIAAVVASAANSNRGMTGLGDVTDGTWERVIDAVEAFGPARREALQIEAVVTKETKTPRSLVCEAKVRFREAAPAQIEAETWTIARGTTWQVAYTADRTDDSKGVVTNVQRTQCSGPGCAHIKTMSDVLPELGGAASILKRRRESDAISFLRSVISGQYAYSAACGQNAYASSLEMLTTPHPDGQPFLSEDATGTIPQYVVQLEGDKKGPAGCTGGVTSTSYRVVALPKRPGLRAFRGSSEGFIDSAPSADGPWTQLR